MSELEDSPASSRTVATQRERELCMRNKSHFNSGLKTGGGVCICTVYRPDKEKAL